MKRGVLRSFVRGLVLASAPVGMATIDGCCTAPGSYGVELPNDLLYGGDGGVYSVLPDADFINGSRRLLQNSVCEQLCGPLPGSARSTAQRGPIFQCSLNAERGTILTCDFEASCSVPFLLGGGRRPRGLHNPVYRAQISVGALLAINAHLEAAAAPGFRQLALDLRSFGAPRKLITAARRAARDEVRHARRTTALAHRYGATPAPVEFSPTPRPGLLDFARHNMSEGCVYETWGAVIATYQGAYAGDLQLRQSMARIAVDEVRHGELAWEVARWAGSRLSRAERVLVTHARREAVSIVRASLTEFDPAVTALAGMPPLRTARALLDATDRGVWA